MRAAEPPASRQCHVSDRRDAHTLGQGAPGTESVAIVKEVPVRAGRAAAVAAVLVLVALAGCAAIPGPGTEPSGPAPSEVTESESGFPPISPGTLPTEFEPPEGDGPGAPELRTEEVWKSAAEDHRAGVIALLQDGVVLSDKKRFAFGLGSDGKQRWAVKDPIRLSDRITDADTISGFARSLDAATNKIIVVAYQWDSCEADRNRCYRQDKQPTPERGIAAFSVLDGKPVWTRVTERQRLVEPGGEDPDDPGKRYLPQVVSDSAVLVEVKPDDSDSDLPVEKTTTIALDPATGKQLWSKPRFVVDWASGDRVLGRDVRPGSGGLLDYDGHPVVLDARTGAELWRGQDLGDWQVRAGLGLIQNAYGYGLVTPVPPEEGSERRAEGQLVDLATGTARPTERQTAAVGRDAEGPFLAWWHVRGSEFLLSSRGLPDGPVREVRMDQLPAGPVGSGGYLWSAGEVMALDRSGSTRLQKLPGGVLAAVDERWLVIKKDSQLVVYRLTG